jgi:hypothetical protein
MQSLNALFPCWRTHEADEWISHALKQKVLPMIRRNSLPFDGLKRGKLAVYMWF